MTGFNASTRHVLMAAILGLGVAGCSAAAPDADTDVPATDLPADPAGADASAPASQPDLAMQDTTDASDGDAPAVTGFDLASVPVSNVPLGDFPYFTLPAGYRNPNRPVPVRDFDRVAVWTGDRLEWLEGRIFESFVHTERGKGWSKLEVIRNLGHQITQAGGVEVTQSKPPREAVEAWHEGQAYSPGRGDIYNNDVATWLVRRADRDIWLHFTGNTASGAWMVIETAAFEATSSLLPASELKQQLDADGRVAIEVNFAVDKADILPASQPQIAQVVQLLRDDPALSLAVEGHTDNTGDAARNRTLSEARAAAVVAALTGAGIESARLQPAGFGDSRPVADNATEDGRARNRRVELVRQ